MSFSQSPGFIAPPPPDPGQTLNALTAMRNYQAQSAQAQAYQGAIDPNTGAFDQNRYNQLLVQQGTRGTWGAGAAMQQAGQASSALGEGTQQQIRAQLMQLNNVNGMYTPLMQAANDPNSPSFHNVPVEKAQAALDQAHQMGLVNDTYYNQGRAILARQAPGSNVYDLVNGLQYANQSAQAQLTTQLPDYPRVDVGSGNVGVQGQPTMSGYGRTVGGTYVPYSLSPSQQVTPIEIRMSDNSIKQVMPEQVRPTLQGDPGAVVVGPAQGGGGAGAGSPSRGYVPYQPQGGGALPPASQGAPAPAAGPAPAALPTPPVPPAGLPPAPAAPAAPPGGIAVPGRSPTIIAPAAAAPAPVAPAAAPSPGVAAQPPASVGPAPPVIAGRSAPMGAGTASDINAQNATHLGDLSGSSPTRQAALGEMEGALSGSTPLTTGVASDFLGKWSNVVNAMLPADIAQLVPGYTPQMLASLEGFHKMAEMVRQQQAGQIGGALTNDKFASALASSPNAALSTLGNLGMIHILQGNEDAINAKNLAWQNDKARLGWQDYQYNAWQTQYNRLPQADPRVYWMDHMSPEERARFIDGMGGRGSREATSLAQNYEATH